MTDVIFSNENISVLGGPAQLAVSLDYGPPGSRGTYIFTGEGKPSDPSVQITSTSEPTATSPQIYDFFINLRPGDSEYLFLYQYLNVNGVPTWERILRLIPNTALANVEIPFQNGQAMRLQGGQPLPGLYFPLGQFFSLDELGTLGSENFNVQYSILNINDPELFNPITNPSGEGISNNPISSSVTLGPLIPDPVQGELFLPVFISAVEYAVVGIDQQTLEPIFDWQPINGTRLLSVALTANVGPTQQIPSEES